MDINHTIHISVEGRYCWWITKKKIVDAFGLCVYSCGLFKEVTNLQGRLRQNEALEGSDRGLI